VREYGVTLEYHVYGAMMGRHGRHWLAVDNDLPRCRHLEAGEHPQQRRLAATRRPQQREEFAAPNIDGGMIDSLHGTKTLAYIANGYECFVLRHSYTPLGFRV
jgi:hypothetical protein